MKFVFPIKKALTGCFFNDLLYEILLQMEKKDYAKSREKSVQYR